MLTLHLLLLSTLLTLASCAPQNPTPLPASWGVYLCPSPNFRNDPHIAYNCQWTNWALMASMDSSLCIYSEHKRSIGPDPGVQCQLWENINRDNTCSGRASPILEYPGQQDVEAWTQDTMGDDIWWTAYRCWLKEPIGT